MKLYCHHSLANNGNMEGVTTECQRFTPEQLAGMTISQVAQKVHHAPEGTQCQRCDLFRVEMKLTAMAEARRKLLRNGG